MESVLRLGDERGSSVDLFFVRLEQGELPSFELRVELRFGAFGGAAERIHIEVAALAQFAAGLESLEHTRSGSALLTAMSPREFQLAVRSVGSRGHMLAEASLMRVAYVHEEGAELRVSGVLAIEPSSLPRLLAKVRQLLAMSTHGGGPS